MAKMQTVRILSLVLIGAALVLYAKARFCISEAAVEMLNCLPPSCPATCDTLGMLAHVCMGLGVGLSLASLVLRFVQRN